MISSGRTGVDQAALRAALECGLDIGGWCAPGRLCDSGVIPGEYPLLETPEDRSALAQNLPISLATEWNARDSEAIVVFANETDPHARWVMECASRYGALAAYQLHPFSPSRAAAVTDYLLDVNPRVLYVTGSSEALEPGIGQWSQGVMKEVFESLYE